MSSSGAALLELYTTALPIITRDAPAVARMEAESRPPEEVSWHAIVSPRDRRAATTRAAAGELRRRTIHRHDTRHDNIMSVLGAQRTDVPQRT